MGDHSLYDEDVLAWAEQQAAAKRGTPLLSEMILRRVLKEDETLLEMQE